MKSEKKGRFRDWKKQDYNNNNEGGFILHMRDRVLACCNALHYNG